MRGASWSSSSARTRDSAHVRVSLCYLGSTMKATQKAKRPGSTEKISVSVDRKDLALLRRRARRLYGGNLSAVVAESAQRIREEEGREALVAWLGPEGEADPVERERLRAEWSGEELVPARTSRRGRAR